MAGDSVTRLFNVITQIKSVTNPLPLTVIILVSSSITIVVLIENLFRT